MNSPLTPSITSAVSRHLVVKDLAASIRYYTGVLGFAYALEEDLPVLTSGAAQVRLHTNTDAVDSTGPLRPPGMAMVFFEVSDLDALRDKLEASGARPTPMEKINWIKYRLFEVRDPDGHRLWFAESYHRAAPGDLADKHATHQPHPIDLHTPPGSGQLRQIMPAFPCALVPEAVKYYRDILGFTVNYEQHDLGVMDRDEVRLLLISRRHYTASTAECCIYIENADRLHAELTAKGALVQGEPVSHPWGLRAFNVLDPDGNCISFAQTFE